jgi:uracil-DNA glycosylase
MVEVSTDRSANMPVKLSCQNCHQELSEEEVKSNKCCPKCDSWLKVNRTIIPEQHKKPKSKTAFVKMLYSNVKKQENSPISECDECFNKNFSNSLKDQLKKCPDSEMAAFNAKPCFPPIGSSAKGQILFIGTNPRLRVGSSDEGFYLGGMKSEASFLQFSKKGDYEYDDLKRNLFEIGHYKIHRVAMRKIGKELGEDSSVAELFMCASKDSSNLREGWSGLTECVCANLFLVNYINIVKPRLIVCFGSLSKKWFLEKFGANMKEKKLFTKSPMGEYAPECYKAQLTSNFSTMVLFTLHPGNWDQGKSLLHGVFLEAFKRLAMKKMVK